MLERGLILILLLFFINREDAKNPKFWSRVCLSNMAKLAKEATTVRRVLESLFRYFDTNDLWSPEHGLALSVLLDMQLILANSGIYKTTISYLCLIDLEGFGFQFSFSFPFFSRLF